METVKYGDIHIGSGDLAYIEQLEKDLDLDASDAELYSLESNSPLIANDIIYFLQSVGLTELEICEDSKERLRETMYTNCLASGFYAEIEDFPEEEREIIENFINLF